VLPFKSPTLQATSQGILACTPTLDPFEVGASDRTPRHHTDLSAVALRRSCKHSHSVEEVIDHRSTQVPPAHSFLAVLVLDIPSVLVLPLGTPSDLDIPFGPDTPSAHVPASSAASAPDPVLVHVHILDPSPVPVLPEIS
jgi:hypothetical protein